MNGLLQITLGVVDRLDLDTIAALSQGKDGGRGKRGFDGK
jgi:hypothetical protein